ncbi:MAG: hypothetical protein CR997_14030 [Acidobacteria bacterium]|nr:MAG: hypothetical protein CR997_14030 [Acidobacteriota bacterium]
MFLVWFLFLQIPQDEIQFDYETTVPVHQFTVKVMKHNLPVKGLKKENFQLKENLLDIKLRQVESVYLPRTIEILVDLSSSHSDRLQRSIDLCRKIITNKEENDRLKISCFSSIYLEWSPFTTKPDVLLKSLSKLQERGSTAFYDAISHAMNSLAAEEGPKALIVIADGQDFMSKISPRNLKSQIKRIGIPILLVYSGSNPGKEANLLYEQYRFLKEITKISQGSWFLADDGYSSALDKRIKDLSFRYRIRYQPPDPDNTYIWRRRQLKVTNCAHCELFYTRGYRLLPIQDSPGP